MVVFIINPLSGRGPRDIDVRAGARVDLVRRILHEAGVAARVVVTQHAGHAFQLARDAVSSDVELVLAWGGDGTMNEVGRALAFGSVPMGFIPGGSGNGLARTLGISLRTEQAIRQALSGRTRSIDAGEVDAKLFFNLAGVGLDAHVAQLFNARGVKRGLAGYVQMGVRELFGYRPRSYAIQCDHETIERDALMVVVANGAEYGNGARIAPDARLDDGLLDLVVVESRSLVRDVFRVRYLFDGTIARRPGIVHRRARAISIVCRDGPVGYHLDGECHETSGPLQIGIRPGALLVKVPEQ